MCRGSRVKKDKKDKQEEDKYIMVLSSSEGFVFKCSVCAKLSFASTFLGLFRYQCSDPK